jgi:hypothetical protein
MFTWLNREYIDGDFIKYLNNNGDLCEESNVMVEKHRLTKMHAKVPTCFNFFNFNPVSTKFPINIDHVILTNRMFFVFQIATFLAAK